MIKTLKREDFTINVKTVPAREDDIPWMIDAISRPVRRKINNTSEGFVPTMETAHNALVAFEKAQDMADRGQIVSVCPLCGMIYVSNRIEEIICHDFETMRVEAK